MALLVTVILGTFQPLLAQDQNGITSPAAGETVSGIVEVSGIAQLPNFRRIELYLLPNGEAARATFVARVNSQANGGVIQAFDSTKYADGEYTLRMRVVRTDYNYTEYLVPIVIKNSGAAAQAERNGISAIRPISGNTVNGPIRITGIAYDSNFRAWRIDLVPTANTEKALLVAESDTPRITAGNLVPLLDTTQFPDGDYTLRLRVIRKDGTFSDYTTPLTINNKVQRTAANNGITAPTANAVLSGTVRITGVADHPQFSKWQLDLLSADDPPAVRSLQVQPLPVAKSAQFVRLDTTLFENGNYTLRLRVVRKDGNYEEYFVPVVIANP